MVSRKFQLLLKIFTCALVLLQMGCAGYSQFVPARTGYEAKSLQLKDPEQTILLIYNHGSQPEFHRDYCYPNAWTTPDVIKRLAGKRINDKEIVVYAYCSPWYISGYRHWLREGEPKVLKRAKAIENVMDKFQAQGVPSKQMFLVGHSAGAWASLLIARRGKVPFKAIIGFAPAFSGPEKEREEGWQLLRDQQVQYISEAPQISALIYAFNNDVFNEPNDLYFLKEIPGIQFVAMDDREIDGRPCSSPDGHRTVFKSCFSASQEADILKYIQSQLELSVDE